MFATDAATPGTALVLQASPPAFLAVEIAGAACRAWLGCKAISARNPIVFSPAARQALVRAPTRKETLS